jgi:hypothetical protein
MNKTLDAVYTPKQRMLNAYRGAFSDRWPVAPEFWYYYPAKVLGVSLVEFEREIPFWQALQATFKKFGTEGWGAAFPDVHNPDVETRKELVKITEDQYRETTLTWYRGDLYQSSKVYSLGDPSWVVEYPVKEPESLAGWIDMALSPHNDYQFEGINQAHCGVGEDYLLELWTGVPFFDFMAGSMGFEKTLFYFLAEDEQKLMSYRQRYIDYQKEFVDKAIENTPFEAYAIGCSYSCNSLIGPRMWRKWDKPYIQAITDELHRHDKLVHIHFHGQSRQTLADFAEIGIDCVCPFERPPGGDIHGLEGLKEVRERLAGRVTMNGNVHTVETLIRGQAEDVRREVKQIKEVFAGSPRLIIGTGDQVGKETPEENIWAMVEEAVSI